MARKMKYAMKHKSNRSKSNRRKSNTRKYRKTRKYRAPGGCNSNSCALSGSSTLWTGKGGAHPKSEQINNDLYNRVIEPSFYSV